MKHTLEPIFSRRLQTDQSPAVGGGGVLLLGVRADPEGPPYTSAKRTVTASKNATSRSALLEMSQSM